MFDKSLKFDPEGSAAVRWSAHFASLVSHILAESLLINRTYQFQVFMENRRNASLQATGFLLVRVDDTYPQLVIIGFVTLFP